MSGLVGKLKYCLILGSLVMSMACTKATPDFEVLNEDSVPQPQFSGSTTKTLQTSSDSVTFQINGECDAKVRNITGSAVGTASTFSNMNSLTAAGLSVTCSMDKKFSFELKSLAALGYTVAEGQVYEIQLRSETSGGTSKPSYIRILYTSAAGGVHPILITSGGTGSTLATDVGSGISASVRVTNKMNRDPASPQVNPESAFLKTGGGISAHIGVRINH